MAPLEPSEQAAAPDGTQDEPAGTATSDTDEATEEAEAALARLLADVGPTSKAPPPNAPPSAAEAPAAPPVAATPAAPPVTAPSSTAPADAAQSGSEPPPAPASVPSREADAALTRLLAEVAGVPADEADEPSPPPASPTAAIAAIAPASRTGAQDLGPGYRIQLAAVRDQEDARRAWASLVDRLGPLVADHQPVYERADTVNGVFYRVQIGPFADGQAAERLCSEVQRHNASCFVVGP